VTRFEPTEEPASIVRPDRLTGSAALRLHLTLAAGLAICVGAFCIEILRALGGNTLSWVYVFEWPFFGAFGIYMWWKLLHAAPQDQASPTEGRTASAAGSAEADDEPDEGLRAWNRYLREMREAEASGREQAT